jgi:predicted nucleotidyltransferase
MTPRGSSHAGPGKIAHTLAALRAEPHGISIYALARKLARPYRRVFENVRRLEREGAVRVEPGIARGRRVSLVFAGRPAVSERIAFPDHLTDLERRLLAALVARLSAASMRVRAIVLFGSRARGRSTPESDVDVAVLVAGSRDRKLEDRIVSIAADAQWRPPFDGTLRLSPLVIFTGEPAGPLRRTLDREGIALWTRLA